MRKSDAHGSDYFLDNKLHMSVLKVVKHYCVRPVRSSLFESQYTYANPNQLTPRLKAASERCLKGG